MFSKYTIGEMAKMLVKNARGEDLYLNVEIFSIHKEIRGDLDQVLTVNYDVRLLIDSYGDYLMYGLDSPFITNVPENKLRKCYSVCGFIPVRIIYNDPATIVFWNDGTKTVVKRAKGEHFNKYTAYCAALAIRVHGNNSRVRRIVESGEDQKANDICKKGCKAKCKKK